MHRQGLPFLLGGIKIMAKKTATIETKKVEELSSVISDMPMEVKADSISEIKTACKRVGISLDDYLKAIKEGLKADRLILDKFGGGTYEPDHLVRLKAATMGLEVEGYLKAKGEMGAVTNVYALQVNQILQQLKVGNPLNTKTIVVKRDA